MSSSTTAILQTVAIDSFRCRLLDRMLALLKPRLQRRWSTSESEEGDAILVDLNEPAGRRYASTAIDNGLGPRLITVGASAAETTNRLPSCEPLRLDTLLHALNRIDGAAAVQPTAIDAQQRYHLLEWPEFDGADAGIESLPLRVCALLARQPLGVREIANLLRLDPTAASAVISALSARRLLLAEHAPMTVRAVPPAPKLPTSPLRQLATSLQRRFGF